MPETMMTIKDVCAYLQIGRTTFYRLLEEEGLPTCRVGKCLRIDRDELRQWLGQEMRAVPK